MKKVKGLLVVLFILLGVTGCFQGEEELVGGQSGLAPGVQSSGSWYFRGTPNSWGTTAMTQEGDTYSIRVEFGDGDGGGSPRFKIDNGNWTENYPSEDYVVEANKTYDITFDAVTKSVDAVEYNNNTSNWYFRGTANNWGTTAMTQEGNIYSIQVEFGDGDGGGGPRFKIDNGDWTENYPSEDYVVEANKTYDITFDAVTKEITATTEEQPVSEGPGVMLHAYRWTFSGIEGALPEIAAAGYKSIQVSPIQGTKTNDPNTEWYLMYQPVNLNIGNAQLGSYDDFESLCNAAQGYGIDIIVDAVLNQVADNGVDGQWDNNLDPALKNWDYFHNNGTCDDYSDRESVTQENLGNGPDWATQRSDVQQLHLAFLNEAIGAGADGFRFDAAKHIETDQGEDAWKPWAGGYWNTILNGMNNKNDLYVFGEVLPDGGDNDEVYTQYFDITAHKYGNALRWGVSNGDLTQLSTIWHHDHELSPTKSLVYVENHDDYEHGASAGTTYWDRKMANAIIVARDSVVPRIFDRPNDDIWNDSDIIEVNKFHNAMVGESEYLRNPEKDVIMIDRGTKGTTIVNVGGDTYINSPTSLNDGSYSSKTGNATLDVSGGYISGNIPGGEIVVLY